MHPTLSSDKETFSEILAYAFEMANHHLERQKTLPPGQEIDSLQMESLPEKGIGARNVLALFDKKYASLLANSTGPTYFGFVTGGSTPAAVAGDWLVSAYDQNTLGSYDSIAPQIERQSIHFLKELFGLDANFFGSFVTGATMANFVGLALGRQWVGEQLGRNISEEGSGDVAINVISGTPHSTILKCMSMLGIGRKSLHKVETLPNREAINVDLLERTLRSVNQPTIVVANAGTVNTVDFDDLEAIGKLKTKYSFWLHVDGAFGGFAACSEKYAHLVRGINYADSITVDAHKWLNVPYDAGMQFTRHPELQLRVFQNTGSYLRHPDECPDYLHYTPESSRRFRALPAWFTLMAYGKEGYREIVERNCACALRLGNAIEQSNKFRLLAPVRMNVVCFTINDANLSPRQVKEFLNAVRDDGRIYMTPTTYVGIPAIRAAVSNWQTEFNHIDETLAVLTEVRQAIDSGHIPTRNKPATRTTN